MKSGDTVRLKSGGPKMTVTTVGNDGKVYCTWFDNTDPKHGVFPPATLEVLAS
jgi:uncharacterized protein YodC (DUF2158 family)